MFLLGRSKEECMSNTVVVAFFITFSSLLSELKIVHDIESLKIDQTMRLIGQILESHV